MVLPARADVPGPVKRALVLGGGGFIGSHLARRLSAEGFWVRCVDLQRPRYAPSAANEFIVGDLRDPRMCTLALEGGFEEVYQLAPAVGASGPLWTGNDADLVRNSALMNLNVLGACTSASVGRIFYSSSACVDLERGHRELAWERQLSDQLYLSHAKSYGVATRIARLPNIFGREGPWKDARANVPAVLCRKIAMAAPGSEIEIWVDSRERRPFQHIDECLDDVERLMRSDCAEPVSVESHSLTINQLALMIMEVAGKTLSIRNVACRLEAPGQTSDEHRGPHWALKSGLQSTYQWITTQVEGELEQAADPGSALPRLTARTRTTPPEHELDRMAETSLLERVRHAIRGRELIDWADTDFASLLGQLDAIHLEDLSQMREGSIYVSDLPNMVRWHARRRTSHVLMTSLDENWGAFSSHVPHRTYPQGDWDDRVLAGGCTPEAVRQYLDDPAVRAVVTPQHTAFWHPSILSIPIGIHNPRVLLDHLGHTDGEKTQELLINNNAWVGGDREGINDRVIANFGGRLRNTYGLSQASFYESVIRSRFVLCPSGMGMDTHRLWETLVLGSIPIVEYSAGWDAVLHDLPVLFVRDFDEVTPDLLAESYPAILSRGDRFDYRKLTKDWWVKGIKSLLNEL